MPLIHDMITITGFRHTKSVDVRQRGKCQHSKVVFMTADATTYFYIFMSVYIGCQETLMKMPLNTGVM